MLIPHSIAMQSCQWVIIIFRLSSPSDVQAKLGGFLPSAHCLGVAENVARSSSSLSYAQPNLIHTYLWLGGPWSLPTIPPFPIFSFWGSKEIKDSNVFNTLQHSSRNLEFGNIRLMECPVPLSKQCFIVSLWMPRVFCTFLAQPTLFVFRDSSYTKIIF